MATTKQKEYKIKPKDRHKKVFDNLAENGGNKGEAILDAGYSKVTSETPTKVIESKGFQQLVNERLSDDKLTNTHEALLQSTRLEHMTFPPFNEEKKDNEGKGEQLTDKDIKEMLASVNCTVRKIVHGDLVRHVYFWSPDNRARKDGLDMAYKLKGDYAPEKRVNLNAYIDIKENKKASKLAEEYENKLLGNLLE